MPLRPAEWYTANAIDLRLDCEVTRIDTQARTVRARGGEEFPFDRLLLATGSSANRLASPGFDHAKVCTLRSFADARGIINQLSAGARAAIVGASFIGMEAAAALRARGVEVEVVSPEAVPFEGVFGSEVGGFLQALHERHGVRFHLRSAAGSFDGQSMSLASGARIDADLVLVGIGATPRTELAEPCGAGTVPGASSDSSRKLRPSSGRTISWSPGITVPIAAPSCRSATAGAETSTSASAAPTSSSTSARNSWFTSRRISSTCVRRPGASTRS